MIKAWLEQAKQCEESLECQDRASEWRKVRESFRRLVTATDRNAVGEATLEYLDRLHGYEDRWVRK
jgi:hypothetical protein